MPKNPNRSYEIDIVNGLADVIKNDVYFQNDLKLKNLRTNKTEVYRQTFLSKTVSYFPAISVFLVSSEYEHKKAHFKEIRPRVIVECITQHEDLDTARDNSFMILKDVKYTFECQHNLVLNGVSISDLLISEIQIKHFNAKSGSLWTAISSMELEILTA